MSAARRRDARQTTSAAVSKWVVGTAIAGTVAIATGAFWLSFTALSHLAVRAGIAEHQAWAWPLIVDGVIIVATVAVVALRGRAGFRYAWTLLGCDAAVSVTANAVQAAMPPGAALSPAMMAAISSVPPITLLAITHLSVVLARHEDRTTTATAPQPDQSGALQRQPVRDPALPTPTWAQTRTPWSGLPATDAAPAIERPKPAAPAGVRFAPPITLRRDADLQGVAVPNAGASFAASPVVEATLTKGDQSAGTTNVVPVEQATCEFAGEPSPAGGKRVTGASTVPVPDPMLSTAAYSASSAPPLRSPFGAIAARASAPEPGDTAADITELGAEPAERSGLERDTRNQSGLAEALIRQTVIDPVAAPHSDSMRKREAGEGHVDVTDASGREPAPKPVTPAKASDVVVRAVDAPLAVDSPPGVESSPVIEAAGSKPARGDARTLLVEAAVELKGQGLTNRQIGEQLGVDATTVGRWLKARKAQP